MKSLIFICLCLTILGCRPSAESRVLSAIEAADQDDLNAFIKTLDANSAEFVTRAIKAGESLPQDWTWMEGSPWRVLAGSTIVSKEEIDNKVARFTLSSPSSEIKAIWVLKADEGLVPEWKIHLMGSKGLTTPLRLVRR